MTGRIAALVIALSALGAGGAMYRLQVYGFYRTLAPEAASDLRITLADGTVQPLAARDFAGIDADSSPIRYRACFAADLPEGAMPYPGAEPLTAPGWFACFDAAAIGAALADGTARAFLGQANVTWGIDRVVAAMPDGRAVAWHQINACGREVFDGRAAPEGCPPQPSRE